MKFFLNDDRLIEALESNGALGADWLAFLGSDIEQFAARLVDFGLVRFVGPVRDAASDGRIMFRGIGTSRPAVRDFEEFLPRHGLPAIDWNDFADMSDYHRAEAAAVIERASEEFEEFLAVEVV